ncbi:MFS transporter [Streptosporangium sp. NPDC004631]
MRSRGPEPVGAGEPGMVVRALLMVVLLFTTEAMFQTLLPVTLQAAGVASGLLVGVFIAVSQSTGLLVAPPAAALGDSRGRARVLVVGGLAVAAAAAMLAAVVAGAPIWLWSLPILGYGLARGTVVIVTLGVVARSGDPYRTQGFNGAAQRLASALAALLTALVVLWRGWSAGFLLMAVLALVFAVLAWGVHGRADRDVGVAVPARASYRESLGMLRREKALRASSLINLNLNILVILGNAFYPITLDVPTGELAAWLLILLLCRDLTSVVTGPWFRAVAGILGLRGVVLLSGACAVAGLLVVGVAGGTLAGVVAGAVLHGLAISMGIGSTNILATSGGDGGTALRLTATNYANSIGSSVLPVGFGLVFDLLGPGSVFLFGAGVSLLLGARVLVLTATCPPSRRGGLGVSGARRPDRRTGNGR